MFSFGASNRSNEEKKINLAELTGLSVTNETYEYTHDHKNHFIRRPVGEEGDGVYAIFGMSRRETASLMTRHLTSIKEMIKPAVQTALETDEFVNFLVFHDIIPRDRPGELLPVQPKKSKLRRASEANHIVNDSVILDHINQTRDIQQQEQEIRKYVNDDALLEALVTPVASLVEEVREKRTLSDEEKRCLPQFDIVYIAYIRFDVSMGKVNYGASPICVLRAVAKLGQKTLSITSTDNETHGPVNPSVLVDNFIELTDYKSDIDEENRVLFTEDPSESSDESIPNPHTETTDLLVSSFGADGEEIFLNQSSKKQLRRMQPGARANEYTVCPLPTLEDKSFMAFGATREEAYSLLSEDLWMPVTANETSLIPNERGIVKQIVKGAFRLAVVKKDFYEYLISEALPQSLKERIRQTFVKDYVESDQLRQDIREGLRGTHLADRTILDVLKDHVNPDGDAPAAGKRFFDALGEDPYLIHAYLHFDLMQKKVEQGWSHPLVLLAYATLKGIKLNMWKRTTWSKKTDDYLNMARVKISVPSMLSGERKFSVLSLHNSEASETVDFYEWLSKTGVKTKRDMHIFFTEGNQFERLEVLSKNEHVSKETLKKLHDEKVKDKEKSNDVVMGRSSYKMTPTEDFNPVASDVYARKRDELQSFYEKTAKEATENNLWNVLKYLIKDSELRIKLEIRQLKELQDIEKTTQRIFVSSGILRRILNLLEYLSAASVLRGQAFPLWNETDDAEKLTILQKILNKIFDEYKKTLIREYARSAADKREQDFITDDMEIVPKSTTQKIAEYEKLVNESQLPYTAVQLMASGAGISQCMVTLSGNLTKLEVECDANEAALKSLSKIVGLRDSSMLGRCIDDRINIGTFLEGKDEFANKYKIELFEIIGQENIRRFQEIRSTLGLSEGDFLYEFFGKYPPTVRPDTVYDHGDNLLHIALQNDNPWRNLPMVRGLLILGVDPGMSNKHGTRPVDVVAALYRDDELGALMLTRISLDNRLINGEADKVWLEKESSFIEAFHAYTTLEDAPKPDGLDPQKAQKDKSKITVYSPVSSYGSIPEPGIFSTGLVDYLISFDQKINYIISHFKQLVSTDKVYFIEPFYSAGEEIVRLNGLIGAPESTNISDEQNAGKIEALKRKRIGLSSLRGQFFNTLRTVSLRSHMTFVEDALDLSAGKTKLSQSKITSDEDVALKNAVVNFDATRGIIDIYKEIAQVALARHSVKSDAPFVEYIEAMMKNRNIHPFPIQNYQNIILQLHHVASQFRREPDQFGRSPNVQALSEFQRQLQPLLHEHDRLRVGFGKGEGQEGSHLTGHGSSGAANKFRSVRSPKNNNSLFYAIAYQLNAFEYKGDMTDKILKTMVMTEMSSHSVLYIGDSLRDEAALTAHLEHIAAGTIAAGEDEIWAMVNLLNLHIYLHDSSEQVVGEYGNIRAPQKIHLTFTADQYYMSLLPLSAPINQARIQPTSPNLPPTQSAPLSPGLRGPGRSSGVYFTHHGDGQPESSRRRAERH